MAGLTRQLATNAAGEAGNIDSTGSTSGTLAACIPSQSAGFPAISDAKSWVTARLLSRILN